MTMTRRALMGAAAAVAAAPGVAMTPASPVSAMLRGAGKRDYAAALEAITVCAQASLAATGLPGMVLALRGEDGFAAELCLGWADLTTRTPVGPEHLFEIGSISKSLVALTLWRLAGMGRVDLDAPLTRYLPQSVLPPEPITAQHLLNHVAGLPNFAPVVPDVEGRLWTGTKPGSSFYYSNTGYTLAGLLIDAVTGRPHPAVVEELVLHPFDMTRAHAHIRSADRFRFATGYQPTRGDRAPFYGSPVAEGPWTEEDLGAGAVAATVQDMSAYLAHVAALSVGKGGPVLGDDAARALLSPARTVDAPEVKGGYSNGFMRLKVDGRPVLHHTGGMLMFASAFDVDPAAGVGAFASVNGVMGEYRPVAVTAYAVRALRAVAEGRPVPPLPDPRAARRVASLDRIAGRWTAADGGTIDIAASDIGPVLIADGRRGRLEAFGDKLAADLPGWDDIALEFEGSAGKNVRPDRLWARDRLFARDHAPAAPVSSPRLQALAGTYAAGSQWVGTIEVVARGDTLVASGLGKLVLDPRGFWHADDDPGGRERLRFDTVIAGKAHRLVWSGNPMMRIA